MPIIFPGLKKAGFWSGRKCVGRSVGNAASTEEAGADDSTVAVAGSPGAAQAPIKPRVIAATANRQNFIKLL